MKAQTDLNRVEIIGVIEREPVMRLVPPGTTFFVSFQIHTRGEWPDHTGSTALLEIEHEFFAQGAAAEAIMWASAGDRVWLIGSLDLIVGDYEPVSQAPIYRQAVRVHTMKLL